MPKALLDVLDLASAKMDVASAAIDSARDAIDPFLPFENLVSSSIVLTTILATWFITYFRWGFGWLVVLLFVTSDMYRRSHHRLKMKIERDLQRQAALVRLNEDSESVEWLNLFLYKFWAAYEPDLSDQIRSSVDSVLETSKPTFLDDLRLTKFTLGSSSPRIEAIRTYPGAGPDVLLMDCDLSFTPVDEDDLSQREKASSDIYNFHIELVARIGAGPASIPLTILLKEFSLSGKLRMQFKFVPAFPHIGLMEFAFLETPQIDFILRPLKGMDLKEIPGLSTFLHDTINFQVDQAIVNPNKIPIDLEAMMNGPDSIDRPIGVLRLSIFEGKQLRNVDITGVSDPCAVVFLGGKEVARTRVIDNKLDPVWNETFHIVVYKSHFAQLANKSDELHIDVMHIHPIRKKLIGSTPSLRLQRWSRLLEPAVADEAAANADEPQAERPSTGKRDADKPLSRAEHDLLLSNWGTPFVEPSEVWKSIALADSHDRKRQTGQVRLDMAYFPVPEASLETPVESEAGIISVVVHQAKDLAASKSASPECIVFLDSAVIGRSPHKRNTNNPTWTFPADAYCSNIETAHMRFVVMDRNTPLGECLIPVKDLASPDRKDDWLKLFNVSSGKIRVTAKFIPLDMQHSSTDMTKIRRKAPCAVLKVNIVKAEKLANVEVLRKSDPYVKLNVSGKTFGATHVRPNTLDPEWNEIFYAIAYSPSDPVLLEVYDWNDMRNDKKLGRIELPIDLILPALQGADQRDNAKVLESLTADGFTVIKKSATSATIRAPLYISKTDELPDTGAAGDGDLSDDESQTGTAQGDESQNPSTTSRKGKGGKRSMLNMFARRDSSTGLIPAGRSLRQRGHITFDVEYFGVVEEKVIRNVASKSVLKTKRSLAKIDASGQAKSADSDAPPSAGVSDARLSPLDNTSPTSIASSTLTDSEALAAAREAEIAAIRETARTTVEQYRSGIFRMRITGAKLCRPVRAYLEIYIDNAVVFRTHTAEESLTPTWLEAADKFVTDMATDSFQILIRQQDGDARSGDDFILGQWTGDPVLELVGHTHDALPIRQYTLSESRMEMLPYVAKLQAEFSYSPVKIDMDLSSKYNSGILSVDILEAKGVKAADSNGFSDPYCIVNLNGTRLHKTKTHKRTLNPVFNEQVKVPIKSRLRSTLEIQLMDWDAVGGDDSLGRVVVHLASLPANQVMTQSYEIEQGGGFLKLCFLFEPQVVEDGSGDSRFDAEARRVDGGTQTGMKKFVKGMTSSFSNTMANNTFMSGFIPKPASSSNLNNILKVGEKKVPEESRYGLEGKMRRPDSPIRGSIDHLSGADAAASQQAPAEQQRQLPGPRRPPPDMSVTTPGGGSTPADFTAPSIPGPPRRSIAQAGAPTVPAIETMPTARLSTANGSQGTDGKPLPQPQSEPQYKFLSESHSVESLPRESIVNTNGRAENQLNQSFGQGQTASNASATGFAGQVTLEIVAARGLTAVDSGGTSDPYIKVTQKGPDGKPITLHRTAVIKKNVSPVWHEEVFVVNCPPSSIVWFTIKDHNTFKNNVELGQFGLDLAGIFASSLAASAGRSPSPASSGGTPAALGSFDEWFPVDGGSGEVHLRGILMPAAGSGPSSPRGSTATFDYEHVLAGGGSAYAHSIADTDSHSTVEKKKSVPHFPGFKKSFERLDVGGFLSGRKRRPSNNSMSTGQGSSGSQGPSPRESTFAVEDHPQPQPLAK
ncbi:C2 domain-containing protein [Entophlyctis helioformis]|nr:C2 domain-containing protein [Entophlyctis helioformis]